MERQDNHAPDERDLLGWATIFHWIGFVLRAPLRHKLIAIAAFFSVFSLACAAIYIVPYRYQVQSTLLAGYPQASALSPLDRGIEATHAARDLLLRRENLRSILEKTNFAEQYLAKRPRAIVAKDQVFEWLRGEPRRMDDLVEGLLDTFEQRLWVDVHREGTLAITFQWWDADLARQVVAAAQESFLEARRKAEVEAINEAIGILEAQRVRLEGIIETALLEFEEKQEQLRSSAPPPRRRAPRAPTRDLNRERLREDLAAKRGLLAEYESSRRQRIAELQAELVRQESIYAANHPALIGTRRMLQSLTEPSQRMMELQSEVDRMERELAVQGVRQAPRGEEGDTGYAALLQLGLDDGRLDFERGRLENLLRQQADLRNRIQGLRIEVEIAEAAFAHRYNVITPARLPRGPIKPYPLIFMMGGLIGGLAFAFFASAAVDVASGRLIERWQVEEELQLPVLMEISKK